MDNTENPLESAQLLTFGRIGVRRSGQAVPAVVRQPKRLAVLTWLAVSTRDGWCSRDAVLGVFWPESDQKRARAALRNALYYLGRAFGEHPVVTAGDDMLRVDRDRLWCDAVAFEEALEAGRRAEAVELYQGDFLSGLHVPDAPDFEDWRSRRAGEYRARAMEAALSLADDGDPASAEVEHWLRRAAVLAPLQEAPVRRLIEVLSARRAPGAARAAYDEFAARMALAELEPSAELREWGAELRETTGAERRAGAGLTLVPRLQPAPEAEAPATPGPPVSPVSPISPVSPVSPIADPTSRPRRAPLTSRTAAVAAGLTVAGVALGQALAPAAEVNDPLADLRTHVEAHEFVAAFEEARELEATHGGQPEFEALRTAATLPVTVRTDRDSVRVSVKDYTRPDAAWIPLGYAPLDSVRVPAALLRWRLEGPEGAVVERAAMGAYLTDTLRFALPDQPAPPGMLQVTGDAPNPGAPRRMALEPFWMDRFEVSNAEFAPFVASGGYTRLEALAAADAQPAGVRFASSPVRRFTDRTGMPGPSTWTSGGYPPETADRPVTGVSWYEAAAYCAWAGKELPTVYHWYDAGGYHGFSDILTQSNFSEAGLADRGSTPGIGPYGHRDLAGNAREWAANTTGPDGGLRFALGGAWDEPHYLYWQPDAIDPMDRSARNGFRCARLRESTSHRSREPVSAGTPDASEREPVSDREFSWILGHYEHDDTPLRGQVEGSGVDGRGLRWQDVSFEPAYEGSRVSARIFLPSSGPAPHSAIVFHPGAEARHLPSPDLLHTWWFAYLVRSGHAVIVPAFKGTLGRQAETAGPIAARDQIVQRIQDLRRTVDYLGTRSDIDSDRIGFMGFSEGGVIAPLAVAADARLRGAIVVSAGLPRRALDPVIDPVNFLPRARTPLLFIGSAHDFIFPPRRSQEPFVELWGTPGSMKTTVTLPGGHAPSDMEPIVMAVLPWLRSTFGAGVATEEAPTP